MNYLDQRQLQANRLARKHGFGRATKIKLGKKNRIVDFTHFGHRKYTTGEYVPNAYLNNFGWKNTYYQQAECVVQIVPYHPEDPKSPYNKD